MAACVELGDAPMSPSGVQLLACGSPGGSPTGSPDVWAPAGTCPPPPPNSGGGGAPLRGRLQPLRRRHSAGAPPPQPPVEPPPSALRPRRQSYGASPPAPEASAAGGAPMPGHPVGKILSEPFYGLRADLVREPQYKTGSARDVCVRCGRTGDSHAHGHVCADGCNAVYRSRRNSSTTGVKCVEVSLTVCKNEQGRVGVCYVDTEVTRTLPGSGAEIGGLRPGQRILRIDGVPTHSGPEVQDAFQHAGDTVRVTVAEISEREASPPSPAAPLPAVRPPPTAAGARYRRGGPPLHGAPAPPPAPADNAAPAPQLSAAPLRPPAPPPGAGIGINASPPPLRQPAQFARRPPPDAAAACDAAMPASP